jgi:outer membrane protein OmpA-like peptidoglycan-associated protein
MSSLLETLKANIAPDLIQNLAGSTGESGVAVNKALETSGIAMLAALASKATDSGFLGQIMNLIKSTGASAMAAGAGGGISNATSGTAAVAGSAAAASSSVTQAGSSLLNMLFGGNMSAITSKISDLTGLSSSSAGTILASAAPMVLSTLATKVRSGGLSTSGLGNLLAADLPSLRSMIPAGLAIPGLSSVSGMATNAAAHMRDEVRGHAGETAASVKRNGWIGPVVILAILALGALIWFMNRGPATNTATNPASSGAMTPAAGLGSFVQSALPDGVMLNIPQNGVEMKLLTFIKDSNTQVTDTTWFDFDRLLFDTNSAALQPSSQEQLSNVANILKAYPSVKLRIGGYTDNQGDASANLKLSQERADAVMQQLVGMGVDPSRLDAKGYGEDHPVADNSTDAGRAMNRRISMRVMQK